MDMNFLDCLDEEIEKAPNEFQKGLKEVFGYITIKSVLSNTDFIPTFWKMKQEIPEELFSQALWMITRAIKWTHAEVEVIGEMDGIRLLVVRDGNYYEIYLEINGKKKWLETYKGKWAYQRAKTILKRLQRGESKWKSK